MTELAWFKCDQDALLGGMAGMPVDERGVYITVICLIYRNGGPVRDEARELAFHCGCTAARWTKYRAALILHGKLKVVQVNGRDHLSNDRCEAELADYEAHCAEMSARGKKGVESKRQNRGAKPNENNGSTQAAAEPQLSSSSADREGDIELTLVPSNDETKGAEAPPVDPNAKAWRDGVDALVALGGMKPPAARTYFGGLLKAHGVEPRELLPAIGRCYDLQTQDPQGLLKAAAKSQERRATGPPKRVAWV